MVSNGLPLSDARILIGCNMSMGKSWPFIHYSMNVKTPYLIPEHVSLSSISPTAMLGLICTEAVFGQKPSCHLSGAISIVISNPLFPKSSLITKVFHTYTYISWVLSHQPMATLFFWILLTVLSVGQWLFLLLTHPAKQFPKLFPVTWFQSFWSLLRALMTEAHNLNIKCPLIFPRCLDVNIRTYVYYRSPNGWVERWHKKLKASVTFKSHATKWTGTHRVNP